MLAYLLIQLEDLFADLVAQVFVFRFLDGLVAEEVSVKFLKHREQGLPELDKAFVDFCPGEDVHPQGRSLIDELTHIA